MEGMGSKILCFQFSMQGTWVRSLDPELQIACLGEGKWQPAHCSGQNLGRGASWASLVMWPIELTLIEAGTAAAAATKKKK